MLSCLLIGLLASDPAATATDGAKAKTSSKELARSIRAKALASAHADSLKAASTGRNQAMPEASKARSASSHAASGSLAAESSAARNATAAHGERTAEGDGSKHAAAEASEQASTPHGRSPEVPAREKGLAEKKRNVDAPPPRIAQCGEIPRSATWKMPEITLNRTLRIPAGMTLWISSGTRILLGRRDSCRAGNAPVGIVVEGRIVIDGDAVKPVVIEPAHGTGEWEGLTVTGSARIDHLRLRAARTGLRVHGSTGTTIRSTLVESCVTGIQVSGGASPTLSHLVITRSQGAGLYVNRASPNVAGCLFLQNRGIAAWFEGSGLTRFENNAFWGNLQGDVAGTRRWGVFSGKGTVTSDADGNLRTDPVLVGSLRDNAWKDSLARAGRRPKDLPFGDPPWALSGTSPLRGKGPRQLARPWSRTDIGLYGLDQE